MVCAAIATVVMLKFLMLSYSICTLLYLSGWLLWIFSNSIHNPLTVLISDRKDIWYATGSPFGIVSTQHLFTSQTGQPSCGRIIQIKPVGVARVEDRGLSIVFRDTTLPRLRGKFKGCTQSGGESLSSGVYIL